eukprot:COSAG06_NODE_14185_length_1181_cov_1.174677_1_plen_197_part_00
MWRPGAQCICIYTRLRPRQPPQAIHRPRMQFSSWSSSVKRAHELAPGTKSIPSSEGDHCQSSCHALLVRAAAEPCQRSASPSLVLSGYRHAAVRAAEVADFLCPPPPSESRGAVRKSRRRCASKIQLAAWNHDKAAAKDPNQPDPDGWVARPAGSPRTAPRGQAASPTSHMSRRVQHAPANILDRYCPDGSMNRRA